MGKKIALTFVLALGLAGPSVAQTTRCVRDGVEVVCRQDRPGLDIGAFQFDETPQAAQRRVDQASQLSSTARQAGQMVARGDCDGARKLALSAGDMALAKQVQDVCQPANGK